MKLPVRTILTVVIIIIVIIVLLLNYALLVAYKTALFKCNTKYILYWIPMWKSKTFAFDTDKYELFKNCKFKNCYATHNRQLLLIQHYDAIIFHAAEYAPIHKKPYLRYPKQRYIFANLESPTSAYPVDLDLYKSFYNWTMTYRLDSDIVMPYGYVDKNETGYVMPTEESIKQRDRLAAWIVSHCFTPNKREFVYSNLAEHIDVHAYGTCGTYECPSDTSEFHAPIFHCYDFIAENYKFYFAFENTHCKDYVTEKLYMILERDIVPIVYGAADYKRMAPPHSVIVADRFASVKKLADYITFLDNNVTEYLKYFEWKKNYSVKRDTYRTACKLCEMLNDRLKPPNVYEDIGSWWFGNHYSYCKRQNELPSLTRRIVYF